MVWQKYPCLWRSIIFHYSILGKPLLVDLIRTAYSRNWKKYDGRVKWARNYLWGPIRYRECNCRYFKYNWIVFSEAFKIRFHFLHCIFIAFQDCTYMRILYCFTGSWFFFCFVLFLFFALFLLYILYSFLSFFYSFTNFFNLVSCFQRQQLLLLILLSLLVAAMSFVMKLWYKLI